MAERCCPCPDCGFKIDRAAISGLRLKCPNCGSELLATFRYNLAYATAAVLAGVGIGYAQGLSSIVLAGASLIYGAVILFGLRAAAWSLGMPLVLKRSPTFIQMFSKKA